MRQDEAASRLKEHAEGVMSVAALDGTERAAGDRLKCWVVPRGASRYDPHVAKRLSGRFHASTALTYQLACEVIDGTGGDGAKLVRIMFDYVDEILQDVDHVLTSSQFDADSSKLVDRSLRMSLLSMAIGIEMDLDFLAVCELGMSALVQDWGILCLPTHLQSFEQPLDPQDWIEYQRHPVLTGQVLNRLHGVSGTIRIAASQAHEMCDGSGYPEGLCREEIHPYARILAAVDAFLALTELRRGRPPIVPHDAIACLVHQIPRGRLDREVVQALLQTVLLYPLGSCVRLSDGNTARVLRRSTRHDAQPVVQHVCRSVSGGLPSLDDGLPMIDLAASDVAIEDVVISQQKRETRLDRSLMPDFDWDGPNLHSIHAINSH